LGRVGGRTLPPHPVHHRGEEAIHLWNLKLMGKGGREKHTIP